MRKTEPSTLRFWIPKRLFKGKFSIPWQAASRRWALLALPPTFGFVPETVAPFLRSGLELTRRFAVVAGRRRAIPSALTGSTWGLIFAPDLEIYTTVTLVKSMPGGSFHVNEDIELSLLLECAKTVVDVFWYDNIDIHSHARFDLSYT
jgi:hypothetical protein